jgi:hypothetical protein
VISDQIRPDLRQGATARSNTWDIPAEVPVNDMAPPIKQRRGVCTYLLIAMTHILIFLRVKVKSFLPVQENRPLSTTVAKPSLTLAKPGSTFGFRPQISEPTAVDLNLGPEEYSADSNEYAVDPSTNVNDNASGEHFSYSLSRLMYIPKVNMREPMQTRYNSAHNFG